MTPQLQTALDFIASVKADIYNAITSKGGNLNGVPFEQWGSVIAGLQFGQPTHPDPVETTTTVVVVAQVGDDVVAAVPLAGYPVPQVPDMVPDGHMITSASANYWPFDFTGEDADSGIPEPAPPFNVMTLTPIELQMSVRPKMVAERTFSAEAVLHKQEDGNSYALFHISKAPESAAGAGFVEEVIFYITARDKTDLIIHYVYVGGLGVGVDAPTVIYLRQFQLLASYGVGIPIEVHNNNTSMYLAIKVAGIESTDVLTVHARMKEVVAPPVEPPVEPPPETPPVEPPPPPAAKQWYGAGGGPYADTSGCFAAAKADFLSTNPDFLSDSIREKFGTGWDRSSDSFTMVVEGRVSMSLDYSSQSYRFNRS